MVVEPRTHVSESNTGRASGMKCAVDKPSSDLRPTRGARGRGATNSSPVPLSVSLPSSHVVDYKRKRNTHARPLCSSHDVQSSYTTGSLGVSSTRMASPPGQSYDRPISNLVPTAGINSSSSSLCSGVGRKRRHDTHDHTASLCSSHGVQSPSSAVDCKVSTAHEVNHARDQLSLDLTRPAQRSSPLLLLPLPPPLLRGNMGGADPRALKRARLSRFVSNKSFHHGAFETRRNRKRKHSPDPPEAFQVYRCRRTDESSSPSSSPRSPPTAAAAAESSSVVVETSVIDTDQRRRSELISSLTGQLDSDPFSLDGQVSTVVVVDEAVVSLNRKSPSEIFAEESLPTSAAQVSPLCEERKEVSSNTDAQMMGTPSRVMLPMTVTTPTPSAFSPRSPSVTRTRARAVSAAPRMTSTHAHCHNVAASAFGTLSTPTAMDLQPTSSHPLDSDNMYAVGQHHQHHSRTLTHTPQQFPQPFTSGDISGISSASVSLSPSMPTEGAATSSTRRSPRLTRTSASRILRNLRSRVSGSSSLGRSRPRTKSAASASSSSSSSSAKREVAKATSPSSRGMRFAPRRPHQSYTAYRREAAGDSHSKSALAKLKAKHSSSTSSMISVSGIANMSMVPTSLSPTAGSHAHSHVEVGGRARSHTVPSAFSLTAAHSPTTVMGPVMTHPVSATGASSSSSSSRRSKRKSAKSALVPSAKSARAIDGFVSCDHDLDTQALIRTEEIDRSKIQVKPDSELYDPDVLRRLVLSTQAACPLDVNELNLRRCAINGDADGIKDLLSTSGVNSNAADTGGWSALILASRYGFLDAVRVLLGFGADINQETNEGWTALMYAVYNKHAEIVEVLLGHDDPPLLQHGTKTNAGWTALMYATYIGSKEIMEILVHKAEPPAHILFETEKGASALTCARMKRRKDLKEFLQRESRFQRKDLVVKGIDSAYGNWVPLDITKLIAEFTTWY